MTARLRITLDDDQRAYIEGQLAGHRAERENLIAQVNVQNGIIAAYEHLLNPGTIVEPDKEETQKEVEETVQQRLDQANQRLQELEAGDQPVAPTRQDEAAQNDTGAT